MFVSNRRPFARRRGVVLILVLAMLSLLAVIGVTFATFSGQTQVSQRTFGEGQKQPDPDSIIDFALDQLINDTDNPTSVIRGHSLKRDMYGNDAWNNGALSYLPDGTPLVMMAVARFAHPIFGQVYQIGTNIPYKPTNIPALATLDFTRWTLRINANGAYPAQTLEVLDDPPPSSGTNHILFVSLPDPQNDPLSPGYGKLPPTLAMPQAGAFFVLDGRWQRAFNGSGVTPFGLGQYPNFLFNGINPNDMVNAPQMDEDYDAADLENWFLALKSADGSVLIPSFHRPGVIRYDTDASGNVLDDWQGIDNINTADPLRYMKQRARFLRPRAVDHPAAGQATFPDLLPDGKGWVTYDVDNDGDGVTDSVWTDLGYPAQRGSNGKLYKPLFAFMVQGLNGKIPLNTAGNLNMRSYADWIMSSSGPIEDGVIGRPLVDHASHLGYSPSEVNPKYALTSMNSVTGLNAMGQPVPGASAGTFQLQKLLQGWKDSNGTPVQGRFGEADLLPAAIAGTGPWPRPGRTSYLGGSNDNYSTLDFMPPETPPTTLPITVPPTMFPEMADYTDVAGGVLLPAERFRKFVTPIDPTGNGRVIGFQDNPALLCADTCL